MGVLKEFRHFASDMRQLFFSKAGKRILIFLWLACLVSLATINAAQACEDEAIYIRVRESTPGCLDRLVAAVYGRFGPEPINASRMPDGTYLIGPVRRGTALLIRAVPAEGCEVKGIRDEALYQEYWGSDSLSFTASYNTTLTILLKRIQKFYVYILAEKPECVLDVLSNAPVKRLEEGYYLLGPWKEGELAKFKLEINQTRCRFAGWRGPYEFTSTYGFSNPVHAYLKQNMTLTATFSLIAPQPPFQPPTSPTTTTTKEKPKPPPPTLPSLRIEPSLMNKLFPFMLAFIVGGICYGTYKAAKRYSEARRRRAEEEFRRDVDAVYGVTRFGVKLPPWIPLFTRKIAFAYRSGDVGDLVAEMKFFADRMDGITIPEYAPMPENLEDLWERGGLPLEAATAGYMLLAKILPIGERPVRDAERAFKNAAVYFKAALSYSAERPALLASKGFEILRSFLRSLQEYPEVAEASEEFKARLKALGIYEKVMKLHPAVYSALEACFRDIGLPSPRELGFGIMGVEPKEAGAERIAGKLRCARCWTPVDYKFKFCPKCGAVLKPEEMEEKSALKKSEKVEPKGRKAEPKAEAKPVEKAEKVGKRLRCPKCGSIIPEGFKYCLKCGYRVKLGKAMELKEVKEEWVESIEGDKPELMALLYITPSWIKDWCKKHQIELKELIKFADEFRKRQRKGDILDVLDATLRQAGKKLALNDLVYGARCIKRIIAEIEDLERWKAKGVLGVKVQPMDRGIKVLSAEPLPAEMIDERGQIRPPKKSICLLEWTSWLTRSLLFRYLFKGDGYAVDYPRTYQPLDILSGFSSEDGKNVIVTCLTYKSRAPKSSLPPLSSEHSMVYLNRLEDWLKKGSSINSIITTKLIFMTYLHKLLPKLKGWKIVDLDTVLRSKGREMAKDRLREVGFTENQARLLEKLELICPSFSKTVKELMKKTHKSPEELAPEAIKRLYNMFLPKEEVELLSDTVKKVLETGEPLWTGLDTPKWLEDLELVRRVPE